MQQQPSVWHESVAPTLDALKERYASVPLLALGQTVFWDEPMKAVLLLMMESFGLEHPTLFAIHDTDYFGKLPGLEEEGKRFLMLSHNDGSTRGLWSAAGEISQLFGSETIPSRSRFIAAGVPFEKIARYYPGGREALLERMTEAWGWRGLVYTTDESVVVYELPLREVLPALEELLQWGIEGTLACLVEPERIAKAQERARQLLHISREHAERYPDWSLSDLYQHLIYHFFDWLIGKRPSFVSLGSSTHLLHFNTQTASLPRFRLVRLFLQPETRPICEKAYNEAVHGSEIYTLDRFGEGALPFDLIVPGRGRGTLLVTERYLMVQTPKPIFVRLKEPVASLEHLASVIEMELGRDIALVGKAITLISMLAHEFLFVMNERGSPYIPRCRQMHEGLRAQGIEMPLYPILRLTYPTWDTIGSDCFWLRLPEHLADTFGQSEICTPSFAQRWRAVIAEQRALLQSLHPVTRPRELLHGLEERVGGSWGIHAAEYDRLQGELQKIHQQAEQIQAQVQAMYRQVKELKAQYAQVERAKGTHFRACLLPLRERLWDLYAEGIRGGKQVEQIQREMETYLPEREAFEVQLDQIREQIAQARERLRELNQQRLALERSEGTQQIRQRIRQIEREAELVRMRLVRHAVLTADGLEQTCARPAAWWFLLLSPNGTWFRETAHRTELRFEEI